MNDQHPSFETLLDLTLGDLPENEAFDVREHLLDCQTCRAQVQDLLEEPDEPAAGAPAVSPADEAAAWSRLQETIEAEGLTPPRTPNVLPFLRPQVSPPLRIALAAGLAVVAFGLGVLVRPEQPSLSTTTSARTFAEGKSIVRSKLPARPTPVQCATAGQTMTWVLSVPQFLDRESGLPLTLEIWELDGDRLELLEGQRIDESGTILLTVLPRRTPDGVYVVKVLDAETPEPELFYFDVQCGYGL